MRSSKPRVFSQEHSLEARLHTQRLGFEEREGSLLQALSQAEKTPAPALPQGKEVSVASQATPVGGAAGIPGTPGTPGGEGSVAAAVAVASATSTAAAAKSKRALELEALALELQTLQAKKRDAQLGIQAKQQAAAASGQQQQRLVRTSGTRFAVPEPRPAFGLLLAPGPLSSTSHRVYSARPRSPSLPGTGEGGREPGHTQEPQAGAATRTRGASASSLSDTVAARYGWLQEAGMSPRPGRVGYSGYTPVPAARSATWRTARPRSPSL